MRLLVARRTGQVKQLPTILPGAHDCGRSSDRRCSPRLNVGASRSGMSAIYSGAFVLWLALGSVLLGCSPPPLQRAASFAGRGRTAEAIATLQEALRDQPGLIEERRLLIRLHGSRGDLAAAVTESERLAEHLPPNDPAPWIELGHAYELAHRYAEALEAYDRAARVAPRSALAAKRGGLRAARWGELALAEPRLEEAVRRDPLDAEAWHALGLVRARLGKWDDARQAYRAGLAAHPEALENRIGLATVALRLEQPEAALKEYESLLAARPGFLDAMLGKSWSLILLGRWESAEAVLREADALGADPLVIARQRVSLRNRIRERP
jgi:tetratricopeptide (TPR) repeat protein